MSIRHPVCHGHPSLSRQVSRWGLPGLCLFLLGSFAAGPTWADDAAAHEALSACVGSHLAPGDSQTMIWVVLTVLADAQPDSEVHALVAGRRDGVIGDTAKLLTRLGESCKVELKAVDSGKPGGAFGQLFGLIVQRSMAFLQGEGGQRAGMLFALDLLKKLDSSVALDLFGPGIAAASGGGADAGKAPEASSKPKP